VEFEHDPRALRKTILNKRNSIPKEERQQKFNIIKEKLFGLDEFKKATHLLGYYGKTSSGEFDTVSLLKTLFEKEKKVYLPRCVPNRIALDIFRVTDLKKDLEIGAYGLYEPKFSKNIITIDQIDLVIVPGLVFDTVGSRYGYGKGYYDSLLQSTSKTKPIKIALTLDFTIQNFALKIHPRDIQMDIIITENKILYI
jgi:5-formyltetrahydrofolate cyclo-ligase